MAYRKVRVGQEFFFVPVLMDRISPPYNTRTGDHVRVVNISGAPKANTMGHCYVELLADANGKPYEVQPGQRRGEVGHQPFGGLVCTNSLVTKDEYIEYLRLKVAALEAGESVARF